MTFDQRLALLITQLAFALLLINEVAQLSSADDKLSAVLDRQQANGAVIKRINAQLDALARGTQSLAQRGDPQAAKIVDQLAQNGIHINGRGGH